MSDYSAITYQTEGRVATITLNRPEKYNAIDRTMAAELLAAFRRVRDEDGVTVVVLAGAGRAFCTGGDLSIFPSLADHTAALDWLAHDGYEIGKAIELCEKVVIAKVHGHCLAGRLELALMCDLVTPPTRPGSAPPRSTWACCPAGPDSADRTGHAPAPGARGHLQRPQGLYGPRLLRNGAANPRLRRGPVRGGVRRDRRQHRRQEGDRPAHGQGGATRSVEVPGLERRPGTLERNAIQSARPTLPEIQAALAASRRTPKRWSAPARPPTSALTRTADPWTSPLPRTARDRRDVRPVLRQGAQLRLLSGG